MVDLLSILGDLGGALFLALVVLLVALVIQGAHKIHRS